MVWNSYSASGFDSCIMLRYFFFKKTTLIIYFLPQKSIDVSSSTALWRCKHSDNTSAANQTPETCCRWVKQCAKLALLLAVAGFVLVIPEQMMCLRPYGRPLGLLCAVTDVAHVNFKGFLLHFKKPPSPLLLLICRMNGESAPRWSGKVCLSFCIQPPPSSPLLLLLLLLLTPAALQPAHSQLQTLFFGERDRLKCPVQPTAAAPGPRHSLAQRRKEGRGLGAPLCGAPPVVLCSLCPLRRVLAGAFVWVLCWRGCAEDWGAQYKQVYPSDVALQRTHQRPDKCCVTQVWSAVQFVVTVSFGSCKVKDNVCLVCFVVGSCR